MKTRNQMIRELDQEEVEREDRQAAARDRLTESSEHRKGGQLMDDERHGTETLAALIGAVLMLGYVLVVLFVLYVAGTFLLGILSS